MLRAWGWRTMGVGLLCGVTLSLEAGAAEPTSAESSAPPGATEQTGNAAVDGAAGAVVDGAASDGVPAACADSVAAASLDEPSVAVAQLSAVPAERRTPEQWLQLARAHVRLGQLVEALSAYNRIPRAAIGVEANAERTRTHQLVPRVDVRLSAPSLAAQVYVDSKLWSPSAGQTRYLNPGWHTFLLEEHGKTTDARRVYLAEGARELVLLKAEEGGPQLTAAPAKVATQAPLPYGEWRDAPLEPSSEGAQRSLFGTGVSATMTAASAVTTAVLVRNAFSAYQDSRTPCRVAIPTYDGRFSCQFSPQRLEAQDRFERNSRLAAGFGIVTALGIASTITFWMLESDTDEPSAEVAAGPGQLLISGKF